MYGLMSSKKIKKGCKLRLLNLHYLYITIQTYPHILLDITVCLEFFRPTLNCLNTDLTARYKNFIFLKIIRSKYILTEKSKSEQNCMLI